MLTPFPLASFLSSFLFIFFYFPLLSQRSRNEPYFHRFQTQFLLTADTRNSPLHRQTTKSNAKDANEQRGQIMRLVNSANLSLLTPYFSVLRMKQKHTTKCRGHGTVFKNEREKRGGEGTTKTACIEGQPTKTRVKAIFRFQSREEEGGEHLDQNKQTNKHSFHF
ncbi:MAG: hypothetical protein JOS17DRAFT_38345 [Linnemannia elongata]|nr:MAG: hypothetical protein JOS17DRAFT_38345 [Linnemannia elongata]